MLDKYLALDVGGARIGLALANGIARIAAPLPTINNDKQVFDNLKTIIDNEAISQLVVGWPRNLEGNATDQTRYVETFIAKLKKHSSLPIAQQDEALTSVAAEVELANRKTGYDKGDIDSLSAVYILEDYLQGQRV